MWVNAAGEKFWVKYHFKTDQGIQNLTQEEADRIAGTDADYHRRDLFNAIKEGNFPSWTLRVQIMRIETRSSTPSLPKSVIKLGWVSFFTDVASEMLYPVVPLFLTSALGAPVVVLGIIEGVAEAIVSIMKGISGWHCDKIGRRVPYIQWGYGLGALSKPLMVAGLGDGALGVVDDDARRDAAEELEGAAVAAKPGLDLLVPDHLGVLVPTPGQGHERTHFQEARYCRLCCRSSQTQGLLPGRDQSPHRLETARKNASQ